MDERDLYTPAKREYEFFFPYTLDEEMKSERDSELYELKTAIANYNKLRDKKYEVDFNYYLKIIFASFGTRITIDLINQLLLNNSPVIDSIKGLAGMIAGFAVIIVHFYQMDYGKQKDDIKHEEEMKKFVNPALIELHKKWVGDGKISSDSDKPRLVIY